MVYLIFSIFTSLFIVLLAFSSGFIYGLVALQVSLYWVVNVNDQLNEILHPGDTNVELVEVLPEIKSRINKLMLSDNKGLFGSTNIFTFLIILFCINLLIYSIYEVNVVIGITILIISFFTISFYIGIKKFAKGSIGFIDLDKNDIYFIASDMFSNKYRIQKFSTLKNLRAKKIIKRGKYGGTFYHVVVDIDEKEIALGKTSSRKNCNYIINTLIENYSLTCEFKVEGDMFKGEGDFSNSTDEYKVSSLEYLIGCIIFLVLSGAFFLFPHTRILGITFSVLAILFFILYYKKKKNR